MIFFSQFKVICGLKNLKSLFFLTTVSFFLVLFALNIFLKRNWCAHGLRYYTTRRAPKNIFLFTKNQQQETSTKNLNKTLNKLLRPFANFCNLLQSVAKSPEIFCNPLKCFAISSNLFKPMLQIFSSFSSFSSFLTFSNFSVNKSTFSTFSTHSNFLIT